MPGERRVGGHCNNVRMVSGLRAPSAADRVALEHAVHEIAHATEYLLDSLKARAAVRTREGEREKARAWGARRGFVAPAS